MFGAALLTACYGLLAVFLLGTVWRLVRMATLPVHLRWELAPVPHEKGRAAYGGSYFEQYEWWTAPREKSHARELIYMLEEILLLKGVWTHNRRLWWFSFPLHVGLYLLVAASLLLIVTAGAHLAGPPPWRAASLALMILAAAGNALGALGAAGLLVTRLTDPRFRAFATPATLFNLVLLLAVFITGLIFVFGIDRSGDGASAFAAALLTADASTPIPAALALHALVVCLFLAYLPFTQMMHFAAKYFLYHKIRWDDEPLAPGSRTERAVQRLLTQPVTWSAPHLRADGRKNWVDIATESQGSQQ